MKCPLCCCREVELLEELSFDKIKALYRRRFHVSFNDSMSSISLIKCPQCDLKFYDPSPAGSEEFYETLSQCPWYYLSEKQEYELALQYFSDADSVLEIGAGTGAFAEKLRVSKYTGLELNGVAVSRARSRGFDVRHDTIENHAAVCCNSYDVVCSFQVLEHVPDVHSFLVAAINCVKNDGLMIHSVPSDDSFIGKQANNILNMPPHHSTRWSDTALGNIAQVFGLELVGLFHESLSNVHVRSYCVQRIHATANKLFGRRDRALDAAYLRLTNRALVRLASLPWEWYLGNTASRPVGHSVTAIYRKRTCR
jgi:SAM-dependent methyltransferase